MKRTVVVTALTLIVCLCGDILAGAQTTSAPKTESKTSAPTTAKKPRKPRSLWVTLSNGKTQIRVLRGFTKKAVCPEPSQRTPEAAMVEMSEKDYPDLEKEKEEFINGFGIFSCKVRKTQGLARPGVGGITKSGTMLLMINHEPDCGAAYYPVE